MRKSILLALTILLAASAFSQNVSAACSREGEAAIRFCWGMIYAGWTGYTPPAGWYNTARNGGIDSVAGVPGAALAYRVGPYNATAWTPPNCTALDTFCYRVVDQLGWSIVLNPVAGTPVELDAGGYFWTQYVTINIPCSAPAGTRNLVVGQTHYTDTNGDCDYTCGDCTDPSYRSGRAWYSYDSLLVKVIPPLPPPAPSILQDTLTVVEQGQTQAYIPFSLCNGDPCFTVNMGYTLKSKGHVGPALNINTTVAVPAARCADIYGIIDAGTAAICTYDTLTMIAWTIVGTPLYDTCVQVIHVVEPQAIPLFTVPVVTILVLALILAGAVFMRRRAVSRA